MKDLIIYTDDGRSFILRISKDPIAEQKQLIAHYANNHKGSYPCMTCADCITCGCPVTEANTFWEDAPCCTNCDTCEYHVTIGENKRLIDEDRAATETQAEYYRIEERYPHE